MFGLVLKYSIHLFIPLAASNPPRLYCQLFLTIMKTRQIYLNGLRMDVISNVIRLGSKLIY
jgi:hypothetical protein